MAEEFLDIGAASAFFIQLGTIIALLLIGVVLVTVILRTFMFFKKWGQYKCVIFFKDGAGNLLQKSDMGGIFKDPKTKNQMFFVRKMRTCMKPDNVPFILDGNKRIAYFLQTGEKNLRPIANFDISEGLLKTELLEEDVNWGIQTYEREKKLMQLGLWEKVLPFLIILIPTVCIMIVMLAFFKNLDVLVDFGRALETAAQYLAQGQQGTTIIPSGG